MVKKERKNPWFALVVFSSNTCQRGVNKYIYIYRRTCILAASSLIDALLVGLNNYMNKHCFSVQPTHTKYQLGVPIVWSHRVCLLDL